MNNYKYNGSTNFSFKDYPTSLYLPKKNKETYIKKLENNRKKILGLQEKLYADGVEGIIVIFQAVDAAGKDGTISHVFGSINPQGINVISFKQPSTEEMAHDYLWRAHNFVPERGKIAIFNRSYYEDVLVVKIHDLQENYKMAKRCHLNDNDFFDKRYRQIKNFEEYLYDNSYRIVKIFLHVSKDEQKKRFLKRIDIPEKNWKFSKSDLKERTYFDEYMKAFKKAFINTATKDCPWYIVPADQKWHTRYIVSEIILDILNDCDPKFPTLSKDNQEALKLCKEQLLNE